jgi:DNA end-binding protein Ku
MAARPTWRGVIKLALVSIPVEIYPATKSGKSIAFHQVHEPSGKRVRYEKVVPGIGPVDRDEILKGYEVARANMCCSTRRRSKRSSWRAARRSS